jgi:hypothetical protein
VNVTEKYHCLKCGCCFVDWGAKKLNFKCPTEGCDQAEMILLLSKYHYMENKPKTKSSKKIAIPIANPEDNILERDNSFAVLDDNKLDDLSDCELDDDDDDDEQMNLEKEKTATSKNQ